MFAMLLRNSARVELEPVWELILPSFSSNLEAWPYVFDLIAEMACKTGEPSIIFIDKINRHNPTLKVGQIESTDPCGEAASLSCESCNLGFIKVVKGLHMLRVFVHPTSILEKAVRDSLS